MFVSPSYARLAQLQRQVSESVLCLSAAGGAAIGAGIRAAMAAHPPALEPDVTAPGRLNFATTYDAASRIALIELDGLLLRKIPLWLTQYGYTDLEFLTDALDQLAGLRPRAVILHLRTHGGLYSGVPEAAARIAEFCHWTAPVYAFTDTHALSAGHWLASACAFFHAAPSAQLGSIGAYRVLVDSSGAGALDGETVHLKTSGPLKGAGYPGTRVSDRHLAALQAEVDGIGAEFNSSIRLKWPKACPSVWEGGAYRAGSLEGRTICDGVFNSVAAHAKGVVAAVMRSR